jgi:hypothetical protein
MTFFLTLHGDDLFLGSSFFIFFTSTGAPVQRARFNDTRDCFIFTFIPTFYALTYNIINRDEFILAALTASAVERLAMTSSV